MNLTFPADPQFCCPLHIGDGSNETGSRLGGKSPEGVRPQLIQEITKYFLTVEISKDSGLELSIFLSFTFPDMIKNRCRPFQNSDTKMVQIVLHGASRRSEGLELASELSAHPIFSATAKEDYIVDEDGERLVDPSHKMGGRVYSDQARPNLIEFSNNLFAQGFVQILQLGFPAYEDANVKGDWPFGPALFHLFGKPDFSNGSWFFFWQA